MKLSLLLCASLIGLAVISSSASFAQGWSWQNPLPQGNYLLGVSFVDANIGTAVGYAGTILRTTDGGATWKRQTSPTPQDLHSVSFADANIGTAVGSVGYVGPQTAIIRTTNGGATWKRQRSGTTQFLNSVSFVDAKTGTIVGSGTILRTTDGGATWTP